MSQRPFSFPLPPIYRLFYVLKRSLLDFTMLENEKNKTNNSGDNNNNNNRSSSRNNVVFRLDKSCIKNRSCECKESFICMRKKKRN